LGFRHQLLAYRGGLYRLGRPGGRLPAQEPDTAHGIVPHSSGTGGVSAQPDVADGVDGSGRQRRGAALVMLLELLPLLMFGVVCLVLMLGYPVAFTLAGVALLFAAFGIVGGHFDPNLLRTFPSRIYGIMTNYTLVAVPLFVF